MSSIIILAFALVVVGIVLWFFKDSVAAFFKFRGTRVVTCPETNRPAAVTVDAVHAATTAPFDKPELRLNSCTRWPEHKNCGQECIHQIELAPEGCLARHMLTSWYEGKSCVVCGKAFHEIQWSDHKPGLMSPEHRITEWKDVPPETIPDVLASHSAVCWDCVIAESFRHDHPELVVDRTGVKR